MSLRRAPAPLGALLALAAACASPAPPPPPPAPAPTPAAGPTPPEAPPPADAPRPAPAAPEPVPGLAQRGDTTRDTTLSAARRHATTNVSLAFVGDINLGTATLSGGVPPDSGRAVLAAARSALTGDMVLGNFEGVLADSGDTEKCGKKRAVVWRGMTPADSDAARASRMAAGPRKRRVGEGGQGTDGRRVADGGRAAEGGRVAEGAEPRRTVRLSEAAPPPRREPHHRPAAKKRTPPVGCYAFLTPTWLAPRLAEAGFTHLNLANNHANDFGLDGRRSTETTLASLGLATYGPLGRIVIDTVRRGGAMTTVGVIGFTTYPFAYDLLDIPASVAVVDSVRRLVDVLVVTFHGGAEGAAALHLPFAAESLGREPRGDLRTWAHAVVDAGADLVVGHGPHVLRGMEFRNGKLIAYSLGNFATYRGFNLAGPQALTGVLEVELTSDGRLVRARLVPMRQAPRDGPAPDPDGAAARLVRGLSEADFGSTAARVGDDGSIAPP